MSDCLIEVCADNLNSMHAAANAGVQRIELCGSLSGGGTTPSYSFIKTVRTRFDIKLHIMIRPRTGDFLYSQAEFEIMKEDIEVCKSLGADGIVFGVLLPDGNVDMHRTLELINLAHPMSCTFHRAFDFTSDPYKALNDLIELGTDRILTSGLKSTAIEGIDLLADLVQKARNRITIMPGAGINPQNIGFIRNKTGATEFHLSGRKVVDSEMLFRQNSIDLTGQHTLRAYDSLITDEQIIRKVISQLNSDCSTISYLG